MPASASTIDGQRQLKAARRDGDLRLTADGLSGSRTRRRPVPPVHGIFTQPRRDRRVEAVEAAGGVSMSVTGIGRTSGGIGGGADGGAAPAPAAVRAAAASMTAGKPPRVGRLREGRSSR